MGCSMTSYPATFAVPLVGGKKQVKTRIVVVFPAPFGPKKPTICPFSTSKEMLSTATLRAYRLVRPSTLIILCLPRSEDVPGCHLGARGNVQVHAETEIPMKFHNTEGGQVLSNEREWAMCP